MAKVKVELPIDYENQISRLGRETDRIVMSALNAAAVPMKKAVLEEIDRTVGKEHVVRYGNKYYTYGARTTGGLRASVGISRPRVNAKGDYDIKVGFAGDVPKAQITYGYLAALIHSGFRNRGTKGSRFLNRAKKISTDAATAAFIKKFDEETGKIL
jgi:hypothetical protein